MRLLFAALLPFLAVAAQKPNVICIYTDDHGWPDLGAAGVYDDLKTPHLDALAQDSLVFDRAYVAVPWCSPSRTALLTSRRADTSRTWSVVPSEYWRQRGGNFTTLTQHFVERGFLTLGMGKIFHPGAASGNNDVRYSWSPESLPYDGSGTSCPTGGPDPAMTSKIAELEAALKKSEECVFASLDVLSFSYALHLSSHMDHV